jgi:hypothetical protein
MEQLRRGVGKPPTPTELTKLHRTNLKRLWSRSPWWPGQTIWLAPTLEERFAEDCRRAGFDPAQTPPVVLDTLRWVWRRAWLDRRDDPAWERALTAGRKRQVAIGTAPEGYRHVPPSLNPPDDPRIKQIHRRANAYELGAQTSPLMDRTTKCRQRKRLAQERRPSRRKLDLAAFITEHGETLNPAFRVCGLDPGDVDNPFGRQLASAWHAVNTEQKRLGDANYGPARKAWHRLLRQLQS